MKMELQNLFKALIFVVFSQVVQGTTYCAYETCYNDDYYCCNGYCCDGGTNIYQVWWFWFIWAIVFLLIVSCAICIRRRRAQNRLRYIRIAEAAPAGYSSVTVQSNQYTHIAPPQYYQQPSAPQMYPPQYQKTSVPQQPPPPYQ